MKIDPGDEEERQTPRARLHPSVAAFLSRSSKTRKKRYVKIWGRTVPSPMWNGMLIRSKQEDRWVRTQPVSVAAACSTAR